MKIIEKVAHKSSLFDVIDGWQVLDIHKQVCPLEGNKKQGNAWSASISNYKNFLDYLEVGIPMGNAEVDRTNDLSVSDYVNFKHILECFCAHLQYVAHNNDATVKAMMNILNHSLRMVRLKKRVWDVKTKIFKS